jgi:ADP-heptose:LPS heptosyltransferase
VALSNQSPTVLSLRSSGLGDLLTAVPALRALRAAFREHHHVLVTADWLAPLAHHSGAVDEVLPIEGLRPLPYGPGEVDVAVNLHGRGPQSHRLLRATRPQRLVAFANTAAGVAGPPWQEDEHEVARWCRLLGACAIAADPERLDLPLPTGRRASRAAGATLVHPGAAAPARRWPPARFAAVARSERRAGRPVVITAGPREGPLAGAVAALAGLSSDAILSFADVLGLASTVGVAARVVCGDTGVAHLATALGTPSVILFGPVAPDRWGPPPGPRHIALWRGGRGDPHGDLVDPGLLAITVSDVITALDHLDRSQPCGIREARSG